MYKRLEHHISLLSPKVEHFIHFPCRWALRVSLKVRKLITILISCQVFSEFHYAIMIFFIRSEKKKYQIKTMVFKPRVTKIPIILNFIPTSSLLEFNFTSSIVPPALYLINGFFGKKNVTRRPKSKASSKTKLPPPPK